MGGEGRGGEKEAAVIFKGRAGEVEGLRTERRSVFSLLHLLTTCLEFRSGNQEALMGITIQKVDAHLFPSRGRGLRRAHVLPQNQRQQAKEGVEA